jgi:phytoene dehydrogenase-like protein
MLLKQIPQKTPIKNLFLVGQWTFPAGGVSAVISGADSCANLVKDYLNKKS